MYTVSGQYNVENEKSTLFNLKTSSGEYNSDSLYNNAKNEVLKIGNNSIVLEGNELKICN
jgi:hypothetical protein